jgi:hypothetical protein
MDFFALMRGGNRLPLERRKPVDEKIIATYCLSIPSPITKS